MANQPVHRFRVLVPDMRGLERKHFSEPFVLYAFLNPSARLTGVVSIPNILDLMGLPSGGGAPGICLFEPWLSDHNKHLSTPRLIIGLTPGSAMRAQSHHVNPEPIGTCVTAGFILQLFELFPLQTGEFVNANSPEAVEAYIKEKGYFPIPLIDYNTPAQIRTGRLDAVDEPAADSGGDIRNDGTESTAARSEQPSSD